MLIYIIIWLVLGLLGTLISIFCCRAEDGYIELRGFILLIVLAITGPVLLITVMGLTIIYYFENTSIGDKRLFVKKRETKEKNSE